MKSRQRSLISYKTSVIYLTQVLLRNYILSEKWIFDKKDFYHVRIITSFGVNPLIDCYDFAFLSYAEAARYASMFSCLSNTRIVISFHHFVRI